MYPEAQTNAKPRNLADVAEKMCCDGNLVGSASAGSLHHNPTIQRLRETLHKKAWVSEQEQREINSALEDLNDPIVQKVLRIINLTA